MKRISRIPRLPTRRRDAHKGDFGRVLVIGGSTGMIGAPALAANAALRGGAGLVMVACPAPIQRFVGVLCPCATSVPLPSDAAGRIHPTTTVRALRQRRLIHHEHGVNVAAIGPGLAVGDSSWCRRLTALIASIARQIPTVIDADGLNAISIVGPQGLARLGLRGAVLTPHPGEMARLLSTTPDSIQSRRPEVARVLAVLLNGNRSDSPGNVVVLKGAETLVTDGQSIYLNRTGNPGMATGGSGDVLTGLIAALIGQHMSPFDAAVLGVYLHGLAGDLVARQIGESGLIATDLIEWLPRAMKSAHGNGDKSPRQGQILARGLTNRN